MHRRPQEKAVKSQKIGVRSSAGVRKKDDGLENKSRAYDTHFYSPVVMRVTYTNAAIWGYKWKEVRFRTLRWT